MQDMSKQMHFVCKIYARYVEQMQDPNPQGVWWNWRSNQGIGIRCCVWQAVRVFLCWAKTPRHKLSLIIYHGTLPLQAILDLASHGAN